MSLRFNRSIADLGVLLMSGIATCLGSSAVAQEAGPPELQEIVVTAQKRTQNLEDVGISISAFSEDQLRDMGVSSMDQLGYAVPGVNIFQFGQQTTTTITIRGVSQNDFSDQNEAPVAVYQDGAYNSFIGGAGFNLFDIDRVEVLRGPQGTLFGRNATGGLIQIITKRPTDSFESYVSVDAGQYGLARLEGAVSGPVMDTVSARLSLSATRQNGFVTNTIGPDKEGLRDLSTRLQIDFHPTEDIDLLWNFRTIRDDVRGTVAYKTARSEFSAGVDNGLVHYPANFAEWQSFCQGFFGATPPPGSNDCFGYRDPNPADPWKVANDTAGLMSRTEIGTAATLTWKLTPAVQLTSITDYLKLDRDYLEDTDGSSLKLFNFFSNMKSWQFSQELRLNGSAGTLNWQTGLYYLDIQHDIAVGVDANTGFSPSFDFFTRNRPQQGTNSYSIFGQLDWSFTPQWTATVGARYVDDRKHMIIEAQCLYGGCTTDGFNAPGILQATGLNESVAPGLAHLKNDLVAAKAELDWRPYEGLLTYASFNRGIKGGGFNAAAIEDIPITYVRYKPEVLKAYELGLKTTFFDKRAQINASAFYYDYHDYQAFTLIGFSPLVFNADALNRGGELEIHFLPFKGTDVSIGAAYQNAIAKNIPLQFPSGPFANQRPPQSPEFTEDLSIVQSWALQNEAAISLQGTVSHVGQRYFNTINDPVLSDSQYTVGNLRLSYKPASGRWEAGVWVNNLFNTQYVLSAFDLSTTNGVVTRIYAPPRQVAATFTYRFK